MKETIYFRVAAHIAYEHRKGARKHAIGRARECLGGSVVGGHVDYGGYAAKVGRASLIPTRRAAK